MNQMIIVGNLTRDVEIKVSEGGKEYTNFTVGETPYSTETSNFFDCTAFGATAKFIADYGRKGDKVMVAGEFRTEKWTSSKDNAEHTRYKVIVQNIQYFGKIQKAEKKASAVEVTQEFVPLPDEDDNDLPFNN